MSKWKERIQGKQEARVFGDAPAPTAVEMSAEQCKRMCEEAGKEYMSGYKDRILKYITTTESKDRYGDIVRVSGADLTNYKKNPVVMFSHQHDNFPVGAAIEINPDVTRKNIPALALFLDNRVDTSGRSDLVYKFAKSKFLPACSIGFLPKKTNRPTTVEERMKLGIGEQGVEYTEWEYLEFSPCGIPANPEALQNVLRSCDFTQAKFEKSDFDLIEKDNILEANILDMFSSFVIDTNKIISVPNNLNIENESTVADPVASEEAPEPQQEEPAQIVVDNNVVEMTVKIDYKEVLKEVQSDFESMIILLEARIEKMKNDLLEIKEFNNSEASSLKKASDNTDREALDIYERVLSGGLDIKL